jgi:MFS transporter, DHA3 family, macrolide efflux protein
MNSSENTQHNQHWARPFFMIWTGQAFSILGSQVVQFALIWWLTSTTGSATVLATASLVGLLPQVFLSPLAGALVDRWNRRITMMAADSTVALATLVLVLLFWSGHGEIWHVYVLMFVRAMAGSFHWPAMQASTSLMVPKEQLSRIQGINQMLNGGMNIASAPLGALLVAVLPLHRVMMIDVFSAMLAVLPLFFVAVPQPPRTREAEAGGAVPSVWQDFAAGLRYIRGWTALVLILGLATIINLFLTPASMLVPLLVTRHFGGEAMHLAWMQTASGVGIIAGGLLLSVWGGFKRRILTSMLGLLVMGGASLAMGLMPANAFLPAVGVMLILGLSNPIVNGPLFAALQACVAPEMQGRVFTVIISVAAAMSPLGLLAAGPVADRLGVQIWFLAGGAITGLMAVGSLFVPVLMNFEDGRQRQEEAKVDGVGVCASPGD